MSNVAVAVYSTLLKQSVTQRLPSDDMTKPALFKNRWRSCFTACFTASTVISFERLPFWCVSSIQHHLCQHQRLEVTQRPITILAGFQNPSQLWPTLGIWCYRMPQVCLHRCFEPFCAGLLNASFRKDSVAVDTLLRN